MKGLTFFTRLVCFHQYEEKPHDHQAQGQHKGHTVPRNADTEMSGTDTIRTEDPAIPSNLADTGRDQARSSGDAAATSVVVTPQRAFLDLDQLARDPQTEKNILTKSLSSPLSEPEPETERAPNHNTQTKDHHCPQEEQNEIADSTTVSVPHEEEYKEESAEKFTAAPLTLKSPPTHPPRKMTSDTISNTSARQTSVDKLSKGSVDTLGKSHNSSSAVPAKLPTPPPRSASSENSETNTPGAWAPPGQSSATIDVETNPDYIALTSALSLLLTQRSVACNDLIQLKKLKAEALDNPEQFVAGLRRTGKLPRVPKMQRIVRAPMVSWKTYDIENVHLDHQLARGLVDRQPALTPIRLFDDQN